METFENLPTWAFTQVNPKSEVVQQAKKDGIPVQFGFLMDLCHLQHSELERYL